MYEFVLVNLYSKISKKKICIRDGISTRALPSTTPPPPSVAIFFIYRRIRKKNTIRKLRLYKFIRVAYSHPLLSSRCALGPSPPRSRRPLPSRSHPAPSRSRHAVPHRQGAISPSLAVEEPSHRTLPSRSRCAVPRRQEAVGRVD
jgi:hypothetical protein